MNLWMSFQPQHTLAQSAMIGAAGACEIEGKFITSVASSFVQFHPDRKQRERQAAFPAIILRERCSCGFIPATSTGYSVAPRFNHRTADAAGSRIEERKYCVTHNQK